MPALVPMPIVFAKQLLVEGRSSLLFCETLIQHLGLSDVQLQNYGGIADLANFLKALRNLADFPTKVASLGIVRDADTKFTAAFQSVCSALRHAGLAEPPQVSIVAAGPPKVSLFLLPDCANDGMLEDLCLQAVGSDPAWACVDDYFACLQRQGVSLPRIIAKARLQAFLASRDRSDMQLGQLSGRLFSLG